MGQVDVFPLPKVWLTLTLSAEGDAASSAVFEGEREVTQSWQSYCSPEISGQTVLFAWLRSVLRSTSFKLVQSVQPFGGCAVPWLGYESMSMCHIYIGVVFGSFAIHRMNEITVIMAIDDKGGIRFGLYGMDWFKLKKGLKVVQLKSDSHV